MLIVDINGTKRECVAAYPDKNYPGYVKVDYKTKFRSYTEWYPIEEFNTRNPDLSSLTASVKYIANAVSGVVSSSTNVTLTDKTQKWQTNSYAGFPVWISRGKGEGQVRFVLSNTKDTIVVDKKWGIRPNRFSQYVLSHNIHGEKKAVGNILPQEEMHKFELKAKKMDRDYAKSKQTIVIDAEEVIKKGKVEKTV